MCIKFDRPVSCDIFIFLLVNFIKEHGENVLNIYLWKEKQNQGIIDYLEPLYVPSKIVNTGS